MLKKKLGIEGIETDWYSDEKLINYFKIPSTLIIPKDVEGIGDYAFRDCKKLERVIFSNSNNLKCIWSGAFMDCIKLKKVTIPESVENIGSGAFWGCYNATIILKKCRGDFESVGNCAFHKVKYVKEEVGN